jgi:lon-related putative ATP-dependent protease
MYAIGPLVDELQDKYQAEEEVRLYLEDVHKDILEHLSRFKAEPEQPDRPSLAGIEQAELSPRDYEVNVLVNQGEQEGAPVVLEMNPTYANLFGRIEHEARFGALTTDFTLIRAGSLHRANGGYLVLPVEEIIREPDAWNSLKRALENEEIIIESAGERIGFLATKSLQPEPIPLEVKVILIGRADYYHLLDAYDDNFLELFKVKADFDTRMDRTPEHIEDYAAFVSTLCTTEGLLHLDQTGLARLVEHGSRLTADQEKLSTHFGELSDVIREANYYANRQGSETVTAGHIQKAIEERFYRSSLVQERLREMVARGTIMIDITGKQVGQVNGLSVIIQGDTAYGQPNRITASIGLGSGGVVDIEREANLGGPVHTKSVMILAGYFAQKFGQNHVLSMTARLVFEQSYTSIEGDSASMAELCALLSALSELPVHQGIAVTGSINQKGEVQAISGVNEKIEGFFDLCKVTGLTGEQGVMIPASNVSNLMLKEEVVQAVREGLFSIWPVGDINEGIEVLTGAPAGEPVEDGFEADSVNDRVDRRLREMGKAMSRAGRKAEQPTILARLRMLWQAIWQ